MPQIWQEICPPGLVRTWFQIPDCDDICSDHVLRSLSLCGILHKIQAEGGEGGKGSEE